jgi:hypothetical protein
VHDGERTLPKARPGALVRTFESLVVGLLALGVVACSRPPALAGQDANAQSAGAAWAGVYQGPYHLYLRLRVRGSKSIGYWLAIGGRSGRLMGTISGDRFDFDWTEHGGDIAAWSGRGYFELHPRHGALPPTIYGEWGLGQNRSGGSWWALKRKDEPTLDDVADSGGDSDDDRFCPSCGIGDFDDFSR